MAKEDKNFEPKTDVIAETDSYIAWKADEPDGETSYHLELNSVTLHFFKEEWDEFKQLVKALFLTTQPFCIGGEKERSA